ncbi:hypothetical protein HUS23_02740 [Ectothiorhodospiraceae bacterium 2226]|nr:hypothetical protein HUS23_02740 [Ectothiorhodospiraceae bacterium 2226]
MTINIARSLWLMACLLAGVSLVDAAELKDPRLRDDDISPTKISVEVTRNAHGHFVYSYDLDMPEGSTGQVRTFALAIGCAEAVDPRGFDPSDYPSKAMMGNFSSDGLHVPAAIDAPWGQAGPLAIAESNRAHWGVAAPPGSLRRGLQLISPYPPGPREYRLIPSLNYNWSEWDYDSVDKDDPDVPREDDMTVAGITTGPACPGEEYPDDGGSEGPGDGIRFAGSPFSSQHELRNDLLTYSAPLRDQFHVPSGTRELELIIHYHEAIDPRTFRVTPMQGQARRLFNPQPGSSETVRIPLQPGKNRIELQVQEAFVPPGRREGSEAAADRGRGGVAMDRDVFVIRVGTAESATDKGRGKTQ